MQVIFIITLFVLLSFFITAPDIMFQASQKAISLWANAVVPSMLPFFILNALLQAAGGIELIGRCFRRPVKKLLKLPGEAAFILATGYCSGVPTGAAIIAELRKKKILSQKDGNRLLAFGSNVSPAFLLSAVSIAMLGNKALGTNLALIHYGTNFSLMLLTCLCSGANDRSADISAKSNEIQPISMEIITEAIFQSLRTIFLIGGIILCFFLFIAGILHTGLIRFFADAMQISFRNQQIIEGLLCGILEITAGSSQIAEAHLPLSLKFSLISAILAFGGLSASLQIASVIRHTDLSLGFYLKYKIIQGVLAFAISLQFPFFSEKAFVLVPTGGFTQTPPSAIHIPFGIWFYMIIVALTLVLIIYQRLCGKRKR